MFPGRPARTRRGDELRNLLCLLTLASELCGITFPHHAAALFDPGENLVPRS